MSAVDDFASEHLDRPWAHGQVGREAPAKALYETYVAFVEARGDKPLPMQGLRSFGVAIMDIPGISRERIAAGFAYHGITVETRAERARSIVLYGPDGWGGGLYGEERERRVQEHVDRAHGGRQYDCSHGVPDDVRAEVIAAIEAQTDLIDQRLEEQFGVLLRWRPGEPEPHDPTCSTTPEEHARRAALWDWEVLAALPEDDDAPAALDQLAQSDQSEW